MRILIPSADSRRAAAAWLPAISLSSIAFAQCAPHWAPSAGVAGVDPNTTGVNASTLWDPDGAGPQPPVLVIGGTFTSAGGVSADNIAIWDGAAFAPVGGGIQGASVDALAALPNGQLIAAGSFSTAGTTPVSNIAAWDGHGWSALGAGVNNQVWAMAVHPEGDLFVGGMFNTAGGVTVNRIARWDGANWTALGTGVDNIVYALATTANGDLYAGGVFNTAGGNLVRRIARWNGSAWSGMAGGMNSGVLSLAAMPNGDIVASGIFTFPGNRIARWNGSGWQALGAGLQTQALGLLPLPNGDLVAGGFFSWAGGVAAGRIARWDGSAWYAMGTGMDDYIIALTRMPNGDIWAGGGFLTADGASSPYLARWSAGQAPQIDTQPADVNACAWGPTTLAVTASGDEPLSYTWQYALPADPGTWNDVVEGGNWPPGAAGPLFTALNAASAAPSVQPVRPTDMGGIYVRVRVENACGSSTSSPAALVVCQLVGDLNCDFAVDLADLATVLANFGRADDPPPSLGDIDGSGAVDLSDLATLLAQFGAACPH